MRARLWLLGPDSEARFWYGRALTANAPRPRRRVGHATIQRSTVYDANAHHTGAGGSAASFESRRCFAASFDEPGACADSGKSSVPSRLNGLARALARSAAPALQASRSTTRARGKKRAAGVFRSTPRRAIEPRTLPAVDLQVGLGDRLIAVNTSTLSQAESFHSHSHSESPPVTALY